jgi:hypothetical protein
VAPWPTIAVDRASAALNKPEIEWRFTATEHRRASLLMQMSTNSPFVPPRKKLSIFWWLGGALLILVALFIYQLLGPNPPIVVSPQTTYITSPLGPDGLPDYEKYILDDYRKGVTPQNNAAALLWAALWPGGLEPADYAPIAAELGLSRVPSTKDAITDPYEGAVKDSISAWLKKQKPKSAAVPQNSSDESTNSMTAPAENDDGPAFTVVDSAESCPWTTQQIPPLAKWVAENQKPLDQMVEASTRSRCYFPSPSMLMQERAGLIAMLLPGVQSVRTAGRTLLIRAMFHAGEKQGEAAWRDLLAVHRIGRLTAQGKTMVEQLVGMAIDGMARDGTLALLDQQSLTVEQVQKIQRDLVSLEYFNGVANSMDSMERLAYLDTVVQLATQKMPFSDPSFEQLSYLNHIRVNWNVALEKGNDFYDRLVKAAQIPQYAARKQALAQFDSELIQLASEAKRPGTLLGGVINPASRSETVASAILAIFLPATAAAMEAQDRSNTMLDLERLAAALAMYRIRNGNYPDKLDQLVPDVLDKLPVDLYYGKPFVYKRTADGYLLYSMGANGNDDGGSNATHQVVEGRYSNELDETTREKLLERIPAGADDCSIRLPRPKFKLPVIPSEPPPNETP